MSLGGLDEQELSSPLLLAVVINNKTSFSKDLFFFFGPAATGKLHVPLHWGEES